MTQELQIKATLLDLEKEYLVVIITLLVIIFPPILDNL